MDYNRIKALLDKYFEGNTSISEEKELGDYFNKENNIPADIEYAKAIFSHITKEKSITYKKPVVIERSKTRLFYYVSGIAASILIVVFVLLGNLHTDDKPIYAYINGKPITDQKIAADYTKRTLLAVSKNLDNGTKNLNYLNRLNKIEVLIKNNEK